MTARKPRKPLTQAEVKREIAYATGLTLKEVKQFTAALGEIMQRELSERGAGVFKLLGFVELRVRRKAATPARQAVHPFTGQAVTFPAKPAKVVVRCKALKKLRDMVS